MKKTNKITLALSSVLLAASLAGCSSSGDGVVRTYKDGKEADVEKAAIKLVKAVKTGDYNLMSAEELKKALDGKEEMVLVDTMPAKSFEKSHIKSAVNAVLPVKIEDVKQENGIFCCMNDDFISGDNQKYMKMYDWMSFFYDFGEKWIGRLKYGHAIDHLRTELMSCLK